jgi:hypothetical protein
VSYLASLARPAETPTRPAAEPVPAPQAETFGEVHEEIVAATGRVALEASDPGVDRSEDRTSPRRHDIEMPVESPATIPEPTLRLPVSRQPVPTVSTPVAPSTPVVAESRAAPTAAEAPIPGIDVTPRQEVPSPVARRVSQPAPVVRAKTEPLVSDALPPTSVPRETERGPDRDDSAYERTPPLRPPIALPVRSEERADRPAVPAAPVSIPRPEVNVHIGAISLTVKAPATAAPAAPPVMPMAQPLPAAVPRRPREGLGFSASRHYLRWS